MEVVDPKETGGSQSSQQEKEIPTTSSKVRKNKIKGKIKEDLELVFGPGASELAEQYQDESKELNGSSEGDTSGLCEGDQASSPKTNLDKSSTPVRNTSRGRTRLRDSGRSSTSSPSPVRPRLDTGIDSSAVQSTGGGPTLDDVIQMGIDPGGTLQSKEEGDKVTVGKDNDGSKVENDVASSPQDL